MWIVARSRDLFTLALEGGRLSDAGEMLDTLDAGGVTTAGQRGYHILVNLAMAGLLCLGPRAGKQQTLLLLDEWVRAAASIDASEALGKLAARYFTGHGPATIKDFVWWAGMTAGMRALAWRRRAMRSRLSRWTRPSTGWAPTRRAR